MYANYAVILLINPMPWRTTLRASAPKGHYLRKSKVPSMITKNQKQLLKKDLLFLLPLRTTIVSFHHEIFIIRMEINFNG